MLTSESSTVSDYIRSNNIPATLLYTSLYYSDIIKFGMLQKQGDGSVLIKVPMPDDGGLVSFAVEQTGLWVKAAFDAPASWIGEPSPQIALKKLIPYFRQGHARV